MVRVEGDPFHEPVKGVDFETDERGTIVWVRVRGKEIGLGKSVELEVRGEKAHVVGKVQSIVRAKKNGTLWVIKVGKNEINSDDIEDVLMNVRLPE